MLNRRQYAARRWHKQWDVLSWANHFNPPNPDFWQAAADKYINEHPPKLLGAHGPCILTLDESATSRKDIDKKLSEGE